MNDIQQGLLPMSELSKLVNAMRNELFLVLDTETTGLDGDSEICSIAVIDSQGQALINSLVKPTRPIPPEATAIHGITNERVQAEGYEWPGVALEVYRVIKDRPLLIYNADFDLRMIHQTHMSHNPPGPLNFGAFDSYCVMQAYAEHVGEWNEYRNSYRWHKLIHAAAASGYRLPTGAKAHGALQDCFMTLAVARHLQSLYK